MNKVVDRQTINQVLPYFDCAIDQSSINPLGNGLINATFLVKDVQRTFVLQRINEHVFKRPQHVVENAELINQHLLQKQQRDEYHLTPIWQLPAKTASSSVEVAGGHWRAIQFIPNCYTVEAVDDPIQASQVAASFARFTSALSDFPADSLHEVIPNFHDLNFRLSQLKMAASKDAHQRLKHCQYLLDFCLSQRDFIQKVALFSKQLPLQVTHNDTKINNLLFCAKSKHPIAVIDLDTCMPGFIMHDFGDMVRTCCSNLPEDATDLENMAFRVDVYEALAEGYVKAFGDNISELELASLSIGAQLLPFMIGIRFLTDYLDGDNYFHTDHTIHNLSRAKNQLNFYNILHKQADQLSAIVSRVLTEA